MNNIHRYYKILIVGALILAGLILRSYNLRGVMTFEWDQARDIDAISGILKGDFTLLGPVVRGEGGFFLGPLYYYLASIPLALMQGDPIALGALSVALDLAGALIFYLFLRKQFPFTLAVTGLAFWLFSPFFISLSQTPWNVSLLLPYIAIISYLSSQISTHNHRLLPLFYLTLSSAVHIHSSAIALASVFAIWHLPQFWHSTRAHKVRVLAYLLVPLLPLLIFDLRHEWLNSKLFLSTILINGQSENSIGSFPQFLVKAIAELGTLFTHNPNLLIGTTILIACSIGLVGGHKLAKLYITSALVMLLTVYLWAGVAFAPYYLTIVFYFALYGLISFLSLLPKSQYLAAFIILALSIQSFSSLNPHNHAFSLASKQLLTSSISDYAKHIDLRLEAPIGRRDGIEYLLKRHDVKIDENAMIVAIIREHGDQRPVDERFTKIAEIEAGGLIAILLSK